MSHWCLSSLHYRQRLGHNIVELLRDRVTFDPLLFSKNRLVNLPQGRKTNTSIQNWVPATSQASEIAEVEKRLYFGF